MKKIFFVSFLAIGTLAACVPPPKEQAEVAGKVSSTKTETQTFNLGDNRYVTKFCDGGRVIYTHSQYQKPGGIAIVENAEECKNNP